MRNLEFLLPLLFSFYLTEVYSSSCLNTTYQNLNIFGNDLSNALGSSSQCCSLCLAASGCVAWSWDNTTGGTCWLKSDTQPLGRQNGTTSGLLSPSVNQTYTLNKYFRASNWFNNSYWHWDLWALTNVTKDVSQATAQSLGMINTNNGKVYMGVDMVNKYPNGTRPSIQIQSLFLYNSGLFILSLDHMPAGGGSWPAWWFTGGNWPYDGEIDVLESIWAQDYNQMGIIVGDTCLQNYNDSNYMTGEWYDKSVGVTSPYYSCDKFASNATAREGCTVLGAHGTFNDKFNAAGGGAYAMQWVRDKYIRIWNFVKPNVPADILNESPNPNPDTWGLPAAHYTLGPNCSPDNFQNHTMMFDIALCGAGWAGNVFPGGEGACENMVQNHPENMTETYWLINYVKVFNRPGEPQGVYNSTCQFGC